MTTGRPVLVLDGMGVLYAVGDDVSELLVPFVHGQGGTSDGVRIAGLYREASLGSIAAPAFWEGVGLDPEVEDTYLAGHSLSAGAVETLHAVRDQVAAIWCLSNDVPEWSRKLRRRFGLDAHLDGSIISGEIGYRKPDAAIFRRFLEVSGAPAADTVFVDDRPANVDAAAALGMETILFGAASAWRPAAHLTAASFADLEPTLTALSRLRAIDVRRATPDDVPFLVFLTETSMGPYVAALGGLGPGQTWHERFARTPLDEHDVVFSHHQPIGCLAVSRQPDVFHLHRVFLLPGFQDCGIGSWLVRRLLREATAAGVPVRLRVFKTNPARRLYERLGFVLIGSTETHYLMERRATSA